MGTVRYLHADYGWPLMPGHHWSEGVRHQEKRAAELDAHRAKVDARAVALERRIFDWTTREWLAQPGYETRPGVPKLNDRRVPDLADLADLDADDEGAF